MLKPAVRRSACDQCRAKRVRCLRAENSTAPCARCTHLGARCVTGASGHPGRPPKPRPVDANNAPGRPAASRVDAPSPGPGWHRTSALRDMQHVEDVTVSVKEPAPDGAAARAPRCRADRHMSWDPLDGIAESGLTGSKPAAHPHPPGAQLAHGLHTDFCGTPSASSAFFVSPSIEQSPAPADDVLALVNQQSSPSQLQGLLSADDDPNTMPHMSLNSITALDMDIDPLLDPWEDLLAPSLPSQSLSPVSSLIRFREEIDRRIAAVDAYYSDSLKVVQGCKEGGMGQDAENPAALLLTCSKEFIDIIHSLMPADRTHTESEDALSTEIVLLVLSSYLALMRLFDSLFHTIYKFICRLPLDSFRSIKVKSVLRIGGISSLQDMSLKTYAVGILDAIQSQVRIIERCMGIPTEYCLSGSPATSPTTTTPGIFSRADRVRLFWAVLEQEDVKPRRGSKSYTESIRANIEDSMKFLDE
jgi:hypothetical protein